MLAMLVIVPLLLAAFLSLIKKFSKFTKYIALAASIMSLLLTIFIFLNNKIQLQSIGWFNISGYQFALTLSTMPLNMILLLIVGVMTPLIIIYSIGFMDTPSEQQRYYFELCVFASSMMLFSIAGDFITMFIGWELLGVTSYLLIGFWYSKNGTQEAARVAITTMLIGDALMLSAIFLIWSSYHTLVFSTLLQQVGVLSMPMKIALTLIMFAVFTKSAQFPFHEWLPEAMKGPTPVSAFLHSSTMVKAGVFLIAVLLPLFVFYNMLYLLIIFGVITVVIAILNALEEKNIKRILAYSTIEDLGLMFIALGFGSLLAAIMLFIVQTFYKALLFMSAGSIIKANNEEEDISKVRSSSSYLNLLIPTAIGVASLAGLYPLSGFFGKSLVGMSAGGNSIVYFVLMLTGFLSSIYIFRWLFVPMRKKATKSKSRNANNPVNRKMLAPIYILAAIVVVSGPILYMIIPKYLTSYNIIRINISILQIAITTIAIILGALISVYLFYYKGYISSDEKKPLHKILYNNTTTKKFYYYLAKLVGLIAEVIDSIDSGIYRIEKGAAENIKELGTFIKRIESGSTNNYIIAFIIGMIIIVLIFLLL
jgi:NADH-quinone oxidoreductase subunit L